MKISNSKLSLAILTGLVASTQAQVTSWINEFHYDNVGIDVGEFVEVASPTGVDVTSWKIVFYNQRYRYKAMSLSKCSTSDTGAGIALTVCETSLKNGSKQSIALVDETGNVLDFIAYNGAIDKVLDGPAAGLTPLNIGVQEGSGTPVGESLQKRGTGCARDKFSWSRTAETPNNINQGQVFSCEGGGPVPSTPPAVSPTNYPTMSPSVSPSMAPSVPPTKYPTMSDEPPRCPSCNETAQERSDLAYDIVKTVSDPVDINNTDTPQGKCFQWIVDEDPYCSCPGTDPKFYQRYVMCVYYYSLDGGNWNECNAPDDPNDPAQVAAANADCTISADGPDILKLPVFQGTDAWLTPSYECHWGGLACGNATGCMDRIEFGDDGLGGSLPNELQNLTELRYIIIKEGTTAGTIPSVYAVFERLHVLDLSFNELIGTIPIEIYDATLLFQLDLSYNFLAGTIAPEVGSLVSIQFIQFEANKLSGSIPTELGNATSLRIFEAYDNELIGSMPQEVCNNRNFTNYTGSQNLIKLTVDCETDDEFFVECAVPECCTDCPISN